MAGGAPPEGSARAPGAQGGEEAFRSGKRANPNRNWQSIERGDAQMAAEAKLEARAPAGGAARPRAIQAPVLAKGPANDNAGKKGQS